MSKKWQVLHENVVTPAKHGCIVATEYGEEGERREEKGELQKKLQQPRTNFARRRRRRGKRDPVWECKDTNILKLNDVLATCVAELNREERGWGGGYKIWLFCAIKRMQKVPRISSSMTIFNFSGALTRHVNSVHLRTGKTKECPICGYVTSSLLNLNSHLSTSHHLEIATAFARPCGSTTTRNKDEGDGEEVEAADGGERHVNGRGGGGGGNHVRESPPSAGRSLREEESPLHPLRPELALSRGVPPSAAAAAAAVAAAHHRQQQLAAAAAAAVAATTAAATGHLFSHPAVAGGLAAAAAAARQHQPPAAAAHAHFAAAAAASPAAQLTAHHLKQLSAEVVSSGHQQKSSPPLPHVFYDCRYNYTC